MANPNSPLDGGRRRRSRPVRSIIVSVIMLGVVLGVARYLGDGLSITDPGWWSHAQQKSKSLLDWGGKLGNDIKDKAPAPTPTKPSPSHTP